MKVKHEIVETEENNFWFFLCIMFFVTMIINYIILLIMENVHFDKFTISLVLCSSSAYMMALTFSKKDDFIEKKKEVKHTWKNV